MKILQTALIILLVSVVVMGLAVQAAAEEKTLTTVIYVTVRETPNELLAEDESLNQCFQSQMMKDPKMEPKISTQIIQQAKKETTHYTICDKL